MDAILKKDDTRERKEQSDGHCKIFPVNDVECVWASAGVVPYKLCNFNLDCNNCFFDQVVRGGCELEVPDRMSSMGCTLCPELFYHPCHTWAKVEANALVRIGIDDFGQNLLGTVENITLPPKGQLIFNSIQMKGRGVGVSLVSPVEGYVVETNERLLMQPSLVNKHPYRSGWIAQLKPIRLSQNLEQLYYGATALSWLDDEVNRLTRVISTEVDKLFSDVGVTLQDGGVLAGNFSVLDEIMSEDARRRILGQFFDSVLRRNPQAT